MKRTMAMILTFVLLLALPAARAEEDPLAASAVPRDSALEVDLDGDGRSEQFTWTMVPGEYDAALTLTVTADDGAAATYTSDILSAAQVAVLDLDGDGAQEILLSGDVMSDDYYTWCLRWQDGAFHEVLFPDGSRGGSGDGYYKYGYGLITGLGDSGLTLTGSQDILGTWFASRTVALTPWERFEFNDDGAWVRSLADLGDDDLWDYGALTTIAQVAYHGDDGSDGVLEPGEKIIIYATDKESYAKFSTRDGLTGTLAISRDYDRGWGCLVDGIPEDQCFESLPYAD